MLTIYSTFGWQLRKSLYFSNTWRRLWWRKTSDPRKNILNCVIMMLGSEICNWDHEPVLVGIVEISSKQYSLHGFIIWPGETWIPSGCGLKFRFSFMLETCHRHSWKRQRLLLVSHGSLQRSKKLFLGTQTSSLLPGPEGSPFCCCDASTAAQRWTSCWQMLQHHL